MIPDGDKYCNSPNHYGNNFVCNQDTTEASGLRVNPFMRNAHYI